MSKARLGYPPVFLAHDNSPTDSGISLMQKAGHLHPYLQKEAEPMMKPNSELAEKGIDRILELSADAHIRRRGTIKDSPEFHKLTGAIAAYGKALELLTALQRWEEFCATAGLQDLPDSVARC